MARNVKAVEKYAKKALGRRIKAVALRKGGAALRRVWASTINRALARKALDGRLLMLVLGDIAGRAKKLWPRFSRRYSFLSRFSEQTFAEAVAEVLKFDRRSYQAIRGYIVERFIPDMKQMGGLMKELKALALKADPKWSAPKLVSGAQTPDGRQIADWLIVSAHPDGRVWIMSVVESKSISNTEDLAAHRGRLFGQHLNDVIRAQEKGIVLEWAEDGVVMSLEVSPKKIVFEAPPVNGPVKGKLYTRFIGVTPRKFKPSELKKLAAQGVSIERWDWPVDEDDLLRMIHDLETELGSFEVVP